MRLLGAEEANDFPLSPSLLFVIFIILDQSQSQGVTERCGLPWLINSALVHVQCTCMSPNTGGSGMVATCGVSANQYSCAHKSKINFG